MPKQPTPISPDEKRRRRAIRLVRSGNSQAEVARRLEVSRQSVSRWVKEAEKGERGWWRRHPLGRMRATPVQAEKIMAWIKANHLKDYPSVFKYSRQDGVYRMCRELGLEREYSVNHFSRLLERANLLCRSLQYISSIIDKLRQ